MSRLTRWFRKSRAASWSGWNGWPDHVYQKGNFQARLASVQKHLADCLDQCPAGPVQIISICAGDGRDVIGVLGSHKRRQDSTAHLIELEPQSVMSGRRQVMAAGLEDSITFLNEDATLLETYGDIAPANIVLVCGVWGHVPPEERASFARGIACLCKPDGMVIWTRGIPNGMARVEEIKSHFDRESFQQIQFSVSSDKHWGVTTHQYCGPQLELSSSGRMFNFYSRAG